MRLSKKFIASLIFLTLFAHTEAQMDPQTPPPSVLADLRESAATFHRQHHFLNKTARDLKQAQTKETMLRSTIKNHQSHLFQLLKWLRYKRPNHPIKVAFLSPTVHQFVQVELLLNATQPKLEKKHQEIVKLLKSWISANHHVNIARRMHHHANRACHQTDKTLRNLELQRKAEILESAHSQNLVDPSDLTQIDDLADWFRQQFQKHKPTHSDSISLKLYWPVVGAVKDSPFEGITFEATSEAAVVAPSRATVLYAGPFPNHKHVVLLKNQNTFIVLCGMASLLCHPRQQVQPGDMIGRMPKAPKTLTYLKMKVWVDGHTINAKPLLETNRLEKTP